MAVPAFAAPGCAFCGSRFTSARTSLSSRPPRRMRVAVTHPRVTVMQDAGGMGAGPGGPGGPPEGPVITKALEISFRNVWIRLMTAGVGPEYDDAIQAFVVSCVAAYKAGYSITALKLELAANETQTKYMGRDVSLNEQEKETRLIWLSLVYLTLTKYRFTSERTPPPLTEDLRGTTLEPLIPGLTGLVESVCDAASRGYSLQTFKMELNLKKDVKDKPISGAEASIRSQWSRIIFATFNILPDSLSGRPKQP